MLVSNGYMKRRRLPLWENLHSNVPAGTKTAFIWVPSSCCRVSVCLMEENMLFNHWKPEIKGSRLCTPKLSSSLCLWVTHQTDIPKDRGHLIQVLLGLPYPLWPPCCLSCPSLPGNNSVLKRQTLVLLTEATQKILVWCFFTDIC